MFCLPPPNVGAGDDEGYYEADNHIGALIRMRTGGNGAAWGPGDFGFLDLDNGDNASVCAGLGSQAAQLRCMMGGEATLTQCYQTRGVNTEPGQKQGITSAAFNTRFDIYEGSMGKESDNALYRPAPNVIKGRKIGVNGGGKCNKDDASTTSMALPLDTCFASGELRPLRQRGLGPRRLSDQEPRRPPTAPGSTPPASPPIRNTPAPGSRSTCARSRRATRSQHQPDPDRRRRDRPQDVLQRRRLAQSLAPGDDGRRDRLHGAPDPRLDDRRAGGRSTSRYS